jgi:hypothetical protein
MEVMEIEDIEGIGGAGELYSPYDEIEKLVWYREQLNQAYALFLVAVYRDGLETIIGDRCHQICSSLIEDESLPFKMSVVANYFLWFLGDSEDSSVTKHLRRASRDLAAIEVEYPGCGDIFGSLVDEQLAMGFSGR